jgi:predicted RNA-binding Zn-ribbon protein involved in translation (DUF1610 family)
MTDESVATTTCTSCEREFDSAEHTVLGILLATTMAGLVFSGPVWFATGLLPDLALVPITVLGTWVGYRLGKRIVSCPFCGQLQFTKSST